MPGGLDLLLLHAVLDGLRVDQLLQLLLLGDQQVVLVGGRSGRAPRQEALSKENGLIGKVPEMRKHANCVLGTGANFRRYHTNFRRFMLILGVYANFRRFDANLGV